MSLFLDLPERSHKPREHGLTTVLDRGLSLAEVDGLVEVAGEAVDFVKLGWGTALATGNLPEKLARYRDARRPGRAAAARSPSWRSPRTGSSRWSPGCTSSGSSTSRSPTATIVLEHERKLELIARLAREFTVFSEVGSKDDERIMAPYRWVEQIGRSSPPAPGRSIAEARESGTVGLYRHDGEVRMGLIDEIAHGIDPDRLVFEAPRKEQQVWFLRRFGPEREPRQHRARRRAVARDAAPRPALRHDARDVVSLLLARHGETDDNIPPIRIQGSRDTPLNDAGSRAGRRAGGAGRRARA